MNRTEHYNNNLFTQLPRGDQAGSKKLSFNIDLHGGSEAL